MATEGPIGARVRLYRRRRGLSQAALAGLVGRSESWLSQVERGIRSVDRLSVLIDIARILHVDVETLAGRPFSLAPNGGPELVELDELHAALGAYPGLHRRDTVPMTLEDMRTTIAEVHRHQQGARYAQAASMLPDLIRSIDTIVSEAGNRVSPATLHIQCSVYISTAKLVRKVGDAQLAWVTGDRAATAAIRAEDPLLAAAAAYQVAGGFLKRDRIAEAEELAITTAEQVAETSPLGLSLRGALVLLAAVIAARRNDRVEAMTRLRHATRLSETLGHDGNHGWTGFGPTNVRIHTVTAAVELGNAAEAIAIADDLDTKELPDGLLSRRAQVHIDAAWAYTQRRQDAAAVVNLLEAERIAPQTLRYNIVVRELLREMLKRERRSATPGLRSLAERAGVSP